jgi:hypothetical protein
LPALTGLSRQAAAAVRSSTHAMQPRGNLPSDIGQLRSVCMSILAPLLQGRGGAGLWARACCPFVLLRFHTVITEACGNACI